MTAVTVDIAVPRATHHDDDWWASLNHGGLLIAPAKLPTYFGAPLPPLSRHAEERLRREVVRMLDDETHLGTFLDHVFEDLLGFKDGWLKGSQVGAVHAHTAVTGESVRPRRLWIGPRGEKLPVFSPERSVARLGVGRGRRSVSRVVEWMRQAEAPIAVLTNGRQIRLIHAGADYDAFCEWDVELFFDEGAPGPQVTALRQLLSRPAVLSPPADGASRLVEAILASRKGQSELSAILGERVRQAVESLIQASSTSLDPLVDGHASGGTADDRHVTPNEIYIAATRVVMRLVVLLFAEARELLPRDNTIYHRSYGLQGLREELDRAAGGRRDRLRHRHAAWPRVLGLFRLVYDGSAHEELPIPAYGGGLFEPGRPDGDGVARALAALERADNALTDEVVHHLLELLTRSAVKVRQGRGSTWVSAPVDFSDLSTEYIGILYEGLLDYELRRAPATDAMVFLDVGHQPALPLDRLREMPPKAIAELLKSLQKEAKSSSGGDDEAESDDDTTDEDASDDDDAEDTSDDTNDDAVDASDASDTSDAVAAPDEAREGYDADAIRVIRELATDWARNAVRHAGWTKRGANLDDPEVVAKAKKLIRRLVLPGEWFLVRWGGTRKGAGTFYTRPQLAGPTTRRTLEPLAYSPAKSSTDPETGLEEVEAWEPKKPEEILALKVCDPAMGSGSFLVSALRYLTDALFESLHHHGRLEQKPDKTIARLADGKGAKASSETLPVPQDADDFEERLRARLKRHVVERCLYGVDIDPVAVELARLALWVETMDPRLPFEFLDHKLKVGNSLVGCWFDRFADYPLAAWERDAGDKDHKNFVHHFREVAGGKGKKKSGAASQSGDVWTQAIKDRRANIRSEMALVLRLNVQPAFAFGEVGANADAVHADARKALEAMHAVAVHDASARAELYATQIRDNPTLRSLRRAFDTWCALWFWPGDRLELAPTPHTLANLPKEALAVVDELAAQHRFFHWELEFPDVFDGPKAGFDAIVGNPPWDIQKPSSKEFFSNLDPLYRGYGKQEALRVQSALFESVATAESDWIRYQDRFKALSNFVKHADEPFGDASDEANKSKAISLARGADNGKLHDIWRRTRRTRRGFSDPEHPFRHQGSADLNTYKLFLELAHALLRQDGQLGLIVPCGLYTDKGTTALRELFLGRCRWRWLFGFENREKIFDIDSRFKFAPVIVQKGGETRAIRAAFMRRKLEEWDRARPTVLAYPRARVEQFSPKSKAILELASERDLEVLSKLYENGVLLGDTSERGWGIKYATEFHMTSDSKLFTSVTRVESESGSLKDVGVWELEGERVFLPLVQGVMLWDGCCFASEYIRGANNRASWKRVDAIGASPVRTQFLMSADARERSPKGSRGSRVGYRMLSNATNERTIVAGLLPDWPCGNSVGVLTQFVDEISVRVCLSAALSSLAFDWQMRRRIAGTNVNWFFMEESYLPSAASMRPIVVTAARLSLCGPPMSREWLELTQTEVDLRQLAWRRLWAASPHERTRAKCQVDATVFHLLGFSEEDIRDVISECDLAIGTAGLDPKGFWRVDKGQPPELRHTVLSLVAFRELQKVGLDAFLSQNDGEGWMLPATLRLADYGLGHDDRAKEHQPVASVLGPRFYDWQLAQGVEESWEECARHAELLDRIVPLPKEEGAESVGKATPSAKKPQTSFEY